MRKSALGLFAVRSEGAILPSSLLVRILHEDPSLEGLTPDDYGLSGTKVREAASQAWNALQGPWRAFQAERAKLDPDDPAIGMTRNRWLTQVLKALGYGALEPLKESLRVEDREFPISHRYKHAPIHLVGCGLDLDRRAKGVVGAATASPHGLVQLYLNAEQGALWGFVSNGLRWRVLRDSQSLSRQAMVEFDLEAIFEGQLYDEFLLFFLVCHQSRLAAHRPEETWLEKWSNAAGEEGKRALDTLRDGVEQAIRVLGQGFLRHPENRALREKLHAGALDPQDYYRQLLRLVYRLLFLFVSEDRGILLEPGACDEARDLYERGYGTQRLRSLAQRLRGSPRYHDLYAQFSVLVELLRRPEGCPELGLKPLGGYLFSPSACPDLDGAALPNDAFLEAIRRLALTEEGSRLARVDFKNLASEELGSVYESLLELHPELRSDGAMFELRSALGNERKSTGSYYTPDSLIQILLDTALEPVVAGALKKAGRDPEARERAILDLKVVDPSAGSGHFLIAAAHRLARHLARIRAGEDEPGPEITRRALRDVVGRCLYGVDLNPMAVELCKLALWIEAHEPGRPLGFLDHHIRVGDSLIGATAELIASGVPDRAYDPIEGDDPEICKALKKRNREERKGVQGDLFAPEVFLGKNLLEAWRELEEAADDDLEAVRDKEARLRFAREAIGMRRLAADAWCAAFTLPKLPPRPGYPEGALAVTTGVLRRILVGAAIPEVLERAIREQAERFRFFHWELEFPPVFERGGFDVVLGNPPWERISLQEKEFFASREPRIARARNKKERAELIREIEGTALHREYLDAKREAKAKSGFLRGCGRFPRSARGDLNLYALFAEFDHALLRLQGRAGFLCPSGLATDANTSEFFGEVTKAGELAAFYDFENSKQLFPIHRSFKFALVTLARGGTPAADFRFFLTNPGQIADESRAVLLEVDDLLLFNPNTGTAPVLRTRQDAELLRYIYRRVPVLVRHGPAKETSGSDGRARSDGVRAKEEAEINPWGVRYSLMFSMSEDSGLFRTRAGLEALGARFEDGVWILGDEEDP